MTPHPLKPHFEEFISLLPARADSERSWTVDLEARKWVASDEARPFREAAARKQHEADRSKERLQALKKVRPVDQDAVAREEGQLKLFTREMREAASKAQEIEYAVYDLKAVNPHRKQETDERTPEELLEIIEQKGEGNRRSTGGPEMNL